VPRTRTGWPRPVDGLEGLSIGNLAAAIGLSKSGLYAHFGSKQELQLATVALRVAAVGWGDWQSVQSIFEAVTLGTVDHWVTCPVQTPAEEFHRSITEFLREWSSQRGGFEVAQVIGERWSARSQTSYEAACQVLQFLCR